MRPHSALWEKPMIAHVSIGVRDIDRSKRFYDTVLEPLGYKCLRAARTLQGYGYGRDSIALWVVQAEHPIPADEKIRSALLLYSRECRRSRCVSCGGAALWRARQRCTRSAPEYMAPITTLPSSSIRTDTALKRISVQAKRKVGHNHNAHHSWLRTCEGRDHCVTSSGRETWRL
jgi:hypothetical protein